MGFVQGLQNSRAPHACHALLNLTHALVHELEDVDCLRRGRHARHYLIHNRVLQSLITLASETGLISSLTAGQVISQQFVQRFPILRWIYTSEMNLPSMTLYRLPPTPWSRVYQAHRTRLISRDQSTRLSRPCL